MSRDTVTIAVMGATGNAGRIITQLLLEDPSTTVIACGRTEAKLQRLASTLGSTRGTLQTAAVDITNETDVLDIASSSDLIVGATSRHEHGPLLASLAMRSGASYYGLYLSEIKKWQELRKMEETCQETNTMVVDDGGCHPGVPAAMVRLASKDGRLDEAWIGAKFRLRWDQLDVVRDTVDDFLSEMENTDPSLYKDGSWLRGYRYSRTFDFGLGLGTESCIPMCLEEIRELADSGIVNSTGFFMAGFGHAVDYGVLPLAMGLARLKRSWATSVLSWGLQRLASADGIGIILLEGKRESDGAPVRIRLSHPDPYLMTAAPAVATIRQMLSNPKPGVWTQADFVAPVRFFEQIRAMGLDVEMQFPQTQTASSLMEYS